MSRNYSDRNHSNTYHPSHSSNHRYHPYQSTTSNSNSSNSYRPSHHANNHRYPSNSHNNNNPRRSHHKDRAAQDSILDDQIAPKHASSSITNLQQWARATAEFPQYGHRKNETQIVERIEARYGDYEGEVPRYTNFEEEEEDEEEVFSMMGVDGKRGREEGWSAVAYVRDIKRRKGEGEGPVDVMREGVIDLTAEDGDKEDADHVESSVWSWPGGDEE